MHTCRKKEGKKREKIEIHDIKFAGSPRESNAFLKTMRMGIRKNKGKEGVWGWRRIIERMCGYTIASRYFLDPFPVTPPYSVCAVAPNNN